MAILKSRHNRTTLKDVAKHVGVSLNAVSKVLNDTRSSAQVSDETRKRIQAAAIELGYKPNILARSLQRQRTDIIALYFEHTLSASDAYTAALIDGAEWACADRKQSLLLFSRRCYQSVDEIYGKLTCGIADGVIIPQWADPEIIDVLKKSDFPAVIFPFVDPDIPSVTIDRLSAAQQTINHLRERGYERIVYWGPKAVGELRRAAFETSLEGSNVKFDYLYNETWNSITDAEKEAFMKFRANAPTAIICWNDAFAYRLLDFCDDNGIRVPEELAVVGFDGAHTFPTPRRKLTTVFVPWSDLTRTAVSLLIDIRDGKQIPEVVQMPVELRAGDTT